jgi:hypothetical protein
MEGFVASGSVPPGALTYPKYKIATLSFALSDVDLHYLDKDLHCSPRRMHQEDADKRSRRSGAWTRDGEDLRFYPEGYVLLDWNSRNNHGGGHATCVFAVSETMDDKNSDCSDHANECAVYFSFASPTPSGSNSGFSIIWPHVTCYITFTFSIVLYYIDS